MQNKQLISQPKTKTSLTAYKKGVKFTVRTPDMNYEVDQDTAEKLSQVLLGNNDVRFIKLKTTQGTVVLNISSIMAISLDEEKAQEVMRFLENTAIIPTDKDKAWHFYVGKSLEASRNRADRETFDYFFDKMRKDTVKI